MRYASLLAYAASQLWAVDERYFAMWQQILLSRAAGAPMPEPPDSIAARAISDTKAQAIRKTEGGVGVLPVMGPISQRLSGMDALCGNGASTEALGQQFDALMADPGVKAVIMQMDSPGGGVNGVQELASKIAAARGDKPIIAQIDSMACSAAYWLASAADEIVMTPGGTAGSIGVYTVHHDVSEALAKEGVKPTLIKAGDYKAEAPPFAPLSDDARDHIQARVNETADAFHRAIAANRNVTLAAAKDRFGKGRSFGADESVERGLADRIGTMEETTARYLGNKAIATANNSGAARAGGRNALFAAGALPTVREYQSALREMGASQSVAARLASASAGILRDGGDGVLSDAVQRELDAALAELSSARKRA